MDPLETPETPTEQNDTPELYDDGATMPDPSDLHTDGPSSLAEFHQSLGFDADGDADRDEDSDADDKQDQDQTPDAADSDWTPPSKEEWEAIQQRLSLQEDLAGQQLESLLKQTQEAQEQEAQAGQPFTPEQLQQYFQPEEFKPDPEVLEKILVDGDGDALVSLLNQFGEVQQKNNNMTMARSIGEGIKYALPVALAANRFYEKFPEMTAVPDVVERTMFETRLANPQANELQILRAVETKLKPIIDRAKSITQKQTRKAQGKNFGPGPVGGGQAPSARTRVSDSSNGDGEDDIETRLAKIHQYAANQ